MKCDERLNAASTASLTKPLRESWLKGLSDEELAFIYYDWSFWARPDQLAPAGDWTTWLILGGRGAGKTRAGAEWVRGVAKGGRARIALVGETYADFREVMIEGASGLLAISPPDERPKYDVTRRRLTWPNGSIAEGFSAEDPDGLRGRQFTAAWSDEIAKWAQAEDAWANLQMGLRLGAEPRQVATTTPRPIALIKTLMKQATTRISRAASHANRANLAQSFFSQIVAAYGGTRLGRQELLGEIIEDDPDALWRLGQIDRTRARVAPDLSRIVVAVDPPASHGPQADACGIIVAGLSVSRGQRTAYVLEDATCQGLSPLGWAERAVAAYRKWDADRIVAEVNQGGDMVREIVNQVDPDTPYRAVRASRGKYVRAEPIASLYEQERVRHVGTFAALEDQMIAFTGERKGGSPDRVDALVWALTDLFFSAPHGRAGVRRI